MPTILLISPEGQSLGNVSIEAAERIAREQYGLDLVEVRPGTFKILDQGKLSYEASKRKQTKAKPTKEIKFKLNIGENDFKTKINQINKFLQEGSTVKVVIWFSGREVSRPEVGIVLMQRVALFAADFGTATMNPELQGKNMTMVITPGIKKT